MAHHISSSDHHAFLTNLAEGLGQAIAENGAGVLVHVAESAAGADVAILPLEGQAPAEALLGTVAPADWSVLGTATTGRAVREDGRRHQASPVEIVVLVPREGEVVSRVRHGGGVFTEPPSTGVTLDCLQRALELPTAPPEVPATHLLAIGWLEWVLDSGRRRRLMWPEMRALYRVDVVPGVATPATAHDLPVLTGEVQAMFDWGRLRRLAIDGCWPESGLAPEDAAWFDEGSFSRWVLSRRPPVPALLAELGDVIGPSKARKCARALDRVGIETAA